MRHDIQRSEPVLAALFVFVAALGLNSAAAADQNARDMARGVSWTPVRPRLFFTPRTMARLRQRIGDDDRFREAWLQIKKRADRLLTEKLVSKEYAEGGTGQHGNYGRPSSQVVNMASTLGLAYVMTDEAPYARKLKEALLHYGQLSRWAGDAKRIPPWHSELNTARFCFGYAVGYDSIYDYLSEAERESISHAMVERGILPTLNDWVLAGERIHALDSMGHNWWSVCVSMAGLAAMSLLGDEPRAEQWVQEVSEAFPEWFSYAGNVLQNKSPNFDRRGAFYESVSYANYALSEYLLFRLAYTNVFGGAESPDIPLLETAGDFFVHTCYPTATSMMSVNFGDSSLRATGARTLRLLLANGYEDDTYHWYLGRTDPGLDDPIGLTYDRVRPRQQAPALPASVLYPNIGWAVLRSSWQDDATMLAVKSGFTWNHAHPDAGSFILFHAGESVIIDSGNCSYSRPEYSSYYRQSEAHNVVLTDGQAQNPEACSRGDRGVKTPGRLYHLLDLAGLKYVFADATGPTSWRFSRNYRHFLWIDDVILIFDDVRTHEAGKLEWLLHYDGSVRRSGSDVIISNQGASVLVRPVFPEHMQVVEKRGLKDHDPDSEVPYLAWSPADVMREAKFVTVIMPMATTGKESLCRVEPLTGDNAIGVRIRSAATITDVYLNLMADGRRMHRNSNNIINGWDTDAYLIAVTRPTGTDENDPDSVTRYFIGCGSYLRKDDKVVLHCLSKVYTAFTSGSSAMEIVLQGQPLVRACVRAPEQPREVRLNGESRTVNYDTGRKVVKLYLDGGG